ncbi:MAG TPA: L-threonylcarbamoyladenylate synthase [Sedimentisphaerales bacterium]|nr:L-threonylcarbamoyladenylate synthase [Sedimentisphaerales bacterium]
MDTQVIKLDPVKPDIKLIRYAAGLVDQGRLVAFPTETVYGLACRVKNDSINELSSVKGRTPEKHYTVHIGLRTDVNKYVPRLGLRAAKLIDNFWPGPLTIVFDLEEEDLQQQRLKFPKQVFDLLYKDNSIGLRCPDSATASILLQLTNNPVVAPSANITGQEPAINAEQVLEQLNGKISAVLDTGPCKYQKSSSVVKIGKTGLHVLRKGLYSDLQLHHKSTVQFLFVCTGNTCRSPMAEGLFKKYWAEKIGCNVDQLEQMGYKVLSVATLSMAGVPVSSESVVACKKKGVDISQHRSQSLSEKLIEQSDLIFTMSGSHRDIILNICPDAGEKCFLLGGDKDVPDPIGKSQSVYNECADTIENYIKNIISEIVI